MANAMRLELEPIGVSMPVVQMLSRLAAGVDLSQLELAQELELEPATVSRLLMEMETEGLVTRRRDPDDKRRVLMAVTRSGAALLARARPRMLVGANSTFSRLSASEHRRLCLLLEKIVDENAPGTRGADSTARRPPARPPRRRAARAVSKR